MAINLAYCADFLEPDSDRVGPSLVLKATACQHFPGGVMETDPSIHEALLSAMDHRSPRCPTAGDWIGSPLRNSGPSTIGILDFLSSYRS